MEPPSEPEPVLRATGITKRFGDRLAVDGVSLEIAAGETYGLLGPNGAGKSTTISVLSGLLAPDSGEVVVAGTHIRPGATDGKSAIGLVPQDLAVYPDLSATENLDFFARLQGMGKARRARRIGEVLEITRLVDRRGDKTDTFSGGMKRRLNIGIGLLHEPKLLVLDEPTVGVDPQSRNAILESVEALSGKGLAVLYTTHYMEEAQRLCHRVGIIDEGRLLTEGPPSELSGIVGEHERLVIGFSGNARDAADRLGSIDGVTEVAVDGSSVRMLVDRASERLGAIIESLTAAGVAITSVDVDRPDLEAVFLHLTGKGLRG